MTPKPSDDGLVPAHQPNGSIRIRPSVDARRQAVGLTEEYADSLTGVDDALAEISRRERNGKSRDLDWLLRQCVIHHPVLCQLPGLPFGAFCNLHCLAPSVPGWRKMTDQGVFQSTGEIDREPSKHQILRRREGENFDYLAGVDRVFDQSMAFPVGVLRTSGLAVACQSFPEGL
jgi:hypothetical protein